MNTRIILIATLLIGITGAGLLLNKNSETGKPVTTVTNKKAEQFIVLLDLSDRITQPAQIEADKEVIIRSFEEFENKVHSHLVINSRDRFQVCIAPQKNLIFDKDIESENLTLDMSLIKTAARVKQLKEFKESLRTKLDALYAKAYVGSDTKKYEGSNIWQFFNETLPALANEKTTTRLLVITDGYFDFEENNAKLTNGKLSTTTSFLNHLREKQDWKSELKKGGYGILPVNQNVKNVSVCVSEIRSKFNNNLNESEMLKFVWKDWLIRNGISDSSSQTILHGSISTTGNQLSVFLARTI